MDYFKGKTVWVTGASRGIGKECALQLANQGASLVLSSKNIDDLESTKEAIGSEVSVTLIPLDLEKHDEMGKILRDHHTTLSQVDVLINNAGVSQRSLIAETKFEVYEKLMNINYLGTVKLSLAMLKIFEDRGSGHFATISSVAGIYPVPLRSGYSASKMALTGFFETMRAELTNSEIKITMIYPGFINTDISIHALKGDGTNHGVKDEKQQFGLNPMEAVTNILGAISIQEDEYILGGFKEAKLGPMMYKIFPSIFKRIIRKAQVK